MHKLFAYLIVVMMLCVPAAGMAQEVNVAAAFEEEYEILNGQYTLDGSNIYQEIDIPSNNSVVYADLNEVLELFEDGTGVIYFGFPECPWCRTLVPVLFEAIEAADYEGPVYYSNILQERDRLSLDENGAIVVEAEGSDNYKRLVEILYDYLGPYNGLNDETIKRVYFPTTVFLKDGAVVNVHLVTVEGQTSGYDPLTEEQHAELLRTLTAEIQAILE